MLKECLVWAVRQLTQSIVLIFTLIIGFFTLNLSSNSHQEQMAQQVLQHSWNTISSHMPGNSGISTALEYLHSRGEQLTDIDLIPVAYARGEKEPEIHRANVVDAKLPGVDLSGSWLDHTDFSDSVLIEAILDNVRMDDTILDRVDLTDASFKNAILKNTSMSGTIATQIKATNLKLESSTLKLATFEKADLEHSKIIDTRALSSNFSDASLISALLSYSYFVRVSFENADFQEAELLGTKFYDVNLSDAKFNNTIGLDKIDWTNSWAWDDKKPQGLESDVPIEYYSSTCRDPDSSSLITKPPVSCKVSSK